MSFGSTDKGSITCGDCGHKKRFYYVGILQKESGDIELMDTKDQASMKKVICKNDHPLFVNNNDDDGRAAHDSDIRKDSSKHVDDDDDECRQDENNVEAQDGTNNDAQDVALRMDPTYNTLPSDNSFSPEDKYHIYLSETDNESVYVERVTLENRMTDLTDDRCGGMADRYLCQDEIEDDDSEDDEKKSEETPKTELKIDNIYIDNGIRHRTSSMTENLYPNKHNVTNSDVDKKSTKNPEDAESIKYFESDVESDFSKIDIRFNPSITTVETCTTVLSKTTEDECCSNPPSSSQDPKIIYHYKTLSLYKRSHYLNDQLLRDSTTYDSLYDVGTYEEDNMHAVTVEDGDDTENENDELEQPLDKSYLEDALQQVENITCLQITSNIQRWVEAALSDDDDDSSDSDEEDESDDDDDDGDDEDDDDDDDHVDMTIHFHKKSVLGEFNLSQTSLSLNCDEK